MKKINFLKLLVLVLTIAVTLALFACNDPSEKESDTNAPSGTTESTSDDATESDTEHKTESNTDDDRQTTETSSDSATETKTETGTETVTEAPSETVTETDTETETETETSSCHPKYASDASGHWSPACDVCGKKAGKVRVHDFYEDVEDEGDLFLYSSICKVCGYVGYEIEVPYEVNLFISPTDLNMATVSNLNDGTFVFEDGVGFARFIASGGSSATVNLYQGADGDDVCGKYMVMKIRLNGGRTSVKLAISSIGAYNTNASASAEGRISFEIADISSGWSTVIIDMSKATSGNMGYTSDMNGDYYIRDLRLTMDGASTLGVDEYVDIAYVMFCESLDEASAFALESSRGYYIYKDVIKNNSPETVGDVCNHKYTYDNDKHTMEACELCGAKAETADHEITEYSKGDKYIYGCRCGYTLSQKTVSKDVEVYLSAKALSSSANAFTKAWSKGELLCENGVTFARIWGKENITDGLKTWQPYDGGTKVSGQYLVIQFRVGENGLGQNTLHFYASTTKPWAYNEEEAVDLPMSENNEWCTYIVDLAHASGTSSGKTSYLPDDDGNYSMTFIQMRLFSYKVADENCYTDISFIAVCDSLDEARALVTEDSYKYKSTRSSVGEFNKDGSCIIHTAKSEKNDNVYKLVCEACGQTLSEKTVPASVNKYMSAADVVGLPAKFYNLSPALKVDDDQTAFARLNFNGGSASQLIWTRLGADAAGPYSDNTLSSFTVDGGRYLVFRMRKSGDAATVNFKLGTIVGDVSYGNVANQHAKEIKLPFNELPCNEWVTCVIDLESTLKDAWVKNSDGGYTVSYFQFTMYAGTGEYTLPADKYFDFEYFAFVDSWEEIAELSTDNKVRLLGDNSQNETNKDGKCDDGKCSVKETVTTDDDGNKTYSYTCAVCGKQLQNRTVPASVNVYVSAKELYNKVSGDHVGMSSALVNDGNETYMRFDGSTSQTIENDKYYRFFPYSNAAGDVSTGRYIVMKYRIPENGLGQTYQKFYVGNDGTGAKNESTAISFTVAEDNQWHIAVIDIVAFMDAKSGGNTGYTLDASGEYCAKYVNMRPFSDLWDKKPNKDDYFDMAYLAFCDDLDEVRALIGSESCDYYTSSTRQDLPSQDS